MGEPSLTTSIESLRRSEARLRAILDAAFNAILLINERGAIEAFNPAAERMFGYPAAEAVGRDLTELCPLSLLTPDGGPLAGAGAGGVVHELTCRRKDGTTFPLEAAVSEVRVDDARLFIVIARDLTGLKEAQERALRAERLAAIGQMVAGLAHESGNALQRIQAGLERLARRVRGQPEAEQFVTEIQRAQDHLQQLYQEVRAYAGPVRLEPTACDLAEVWRETWANLEPRRRGRQATLREHADGLDLACVADPFRLGQVFRNILENALAACTDPVEIVVRCSPAELDGRPAVRIAVRDNGPGLSPEQCEKIFEPFYTTKTTGTGLGMAIARRLVEAHGGRIAVGGPGPGAEIVILLPWRKP